MKKKLIRLTEGDLHRIVKESINAILNEVGETESGQELLGRLAARKSFNGDKGYFDVDDYAKEKSRGNLKTRDKYAKAFHKETDKLKSDNLIN